MFQRNCAWTIRYPYVRRRRRRKRRRERRRKRRRRRGRKQKKRNKKEKNVIYKSHHIQKLTLKIQHRPRFKS